MKFCSGCKRCFDDDASACGDGCETPLSETRDGDRDLVEGYHLEHWLDSGVRGETFRARRIDCGRLCVIKIVHADDATAERFLREASIAQSIFHHGITDTYEAGRLNDSEIFVVAEDPQTQTLRDLLHSAGVPELLTAVQIVRQTAEAVHALHASGIAHGAVNPANIFITTDHKGELLVRLANIDFGGAVGHAIVSNKFLIDTALDSLRYFSPEQCRGEAATERSDVYALGIVLFEILAGSPPFDAANASGLIEQQLSMHSPDIKINNFDLRALLSHTLMEALQKQPSLRQASADLFARQLRHVEQLALHAATPPPVVAVLTEPRKAAAAASVVTITATELDLPSLAEVEAAGAGFAAIKEPQSVTAVEEIKVIPIVDAYSETLGPRAADLNALVSESPYPSPKPNGLMAKAVLLAAELLEKASPNEPTPHETIDFRAVREKIPALLAEAEALNFAPRPQPKPVEWSHPLDDIPSVDDAMEALRREGNVPTFGSSFESAGTLPIEVSSGMEKDAGPQIEKRVKKERPIEATVAAIVPGRATDHLVPAFLVTSRADKPVHIGDRSELFSAIDGLSAVRYPRARRIAAAAAVFGALAMAYILRGDIAEALTPYDLAAQFPEPSRPAEVTPSIPAAPAVPVSSVPDVIGDQPVQETEPPARVNASNEKTDEIKPISIATSAPRHARKETDDEEQIAAPSRPQRENVTAKTDPPIVPATRVITYKRDPDAHRDPLTAPKSAAGLTRPRIVKNPKP